MTTKLKTIIWTALLCVVFTIGLHAQGTAFTYQGQLLTTNGPANGLYDLTFALYTAGTGGSQVGSTVTDAGQVVTNGLFTLTMDFGAGIFDGTSYWLQIGVRTNLTGSFSPLSPRQKLTPTPYAITSENVLMNGLAAGTYGNAVTFNNAANSFTGSGAGLTSLNASSLTSGTVPDARLSANVALLDRNQTFTGNQTFAGQVNLPSPVATIYSGGTTVLDSDFNNVNFFVGRGAGNLIVSGTANTGVGDDALISDLSGGGNTANGFEALYDNTSGSDNTASGAFALQANTSGNHNTANGFEALYSNRDGADNTASGTSALYSNTNGVDNTANGVSALYANTSGSDNTASGDSALTSNTTGTDNTAEGREALYSNTNGSANTANGALALFSNTSGADNAANGYGALLANTVGADNTANGAQALYNNISGSDNTANGFDALYYNTNNDNTANGAYALFFNRSGFENTATGYLALYDNTNNDNTADGASALYYNRGGYGNTASGAAALQNNFSGNNNTACGELALQNNTDGNDNTACGDGALRDNTSGSENIALGSYAGALVTTGYDNIEIGTQGDPNDDHTIRIGSTQSNTFVNGIYSATIANGTPVYVNSSGQLGALTSSKRFKQNIHKMGAASDALYSLQPVTFQYQPGIDPAGTPEFGLVAEQVQKVDPALVVLDKTGQPYTVRYQAVNAMLLNEFLKEHHTVQEQGAEIQRLRQAVAQLKSLVNQMAEGKKGEAQ